MYFSCYNDVDTDGYGCSHIFGCICGCGYWCGYGCGPVYFLHDSVEIFCCQPTSLTFNALIDLPLWGKC